MRCFLGVDVGGTKTHLLIADELGQIVGFGHSGPGNPQTVGYDGMTSSLSQGLKQVLQTSKLAVTDLSGAGFAIAGFGRDLCAVGNVDMRGRGVDKAAITLVGG